MAKATGVLSVILHSDSKVVIKYINGDYEAKGERMKNYLNLIKRWTSQDFMVDFIQVQRKENEHADIVVRPYPSLSTPLPLKNWRYR